MKIKNKLKNIIDGYKNLISEDELLSDLFQSRYETCLQCPNNKFSICQLCLCPVMAKSHSPLENCPDNPPRWLPIHYIDNTLDKKFQYVLKSELPKNLQKYFEEEEIELSKWLEFLKINHKEEEEIFDYEKGDL